MTGLSDDIVGLTDLVLQDALARHRRNLTRQRALREEAAQLDEMRAAAHARGTGCGPAQLAGADLAWGAWLSDRKSRIRQEDLQLRLLLDQSQGAARAAFSRHQAALALAKEDADTARLATERKRQRTLDALLLLQACRD